MSGRAQRAAQRMGDVGTRRLQGGAVCTRLKVRGAGWDMTPRLLSSTIDGGTNVRPEFLAAV